MTYLFGKYRRMGCVGPPDNLRFERATSQNLGFIEVYFPLISNWSLQQSIGIVSVVSVQNDGLLENAASVRAVFEAYAPFSPLLSFLHSRGITTSLEESPFREL